MLKYANIRALKHARRIRTLERVGDKGDVLVARLQIIMKCYERNYHDFVEIYSIIYQAVCVWRGGGTPMIFIRGRADPISKPIPT